MGGLLRHRPSGADAVLWWLGQSGIAIRYLDELLVIDPYLSDTLTEKYANSATPHVRMHDRLMSPLALARSGVTVLAATHQHTDHLDPGTLKPVVSWCRQTGAGIPPLVAPEAWRELAAERSGLPAGEIVGVDAGSSVQIGAFELAALPSAHEQVEYDVAGHCKYLGYVVRFGRWRVYHSGDTLAYDGLSDRLAPFAVDLAVLPINGKVGNMSGRDAARLASACGARLVIPCHYDMFTFNTADPGAEFIPECERLGQAFRVLRPGEPLVL
jgi:L-ascorbate metabolism protein UlaG (beta-lactamase superfamily)